MKKTILFFGIVAGIFTANAQTTDPVTLNVNLHPLQTITVGKATINLDYVTEKNYLDGVAVDEMGHLTVFSTGKFDVKVKAKTDLTTAGGTITLTDPKTAITITATQGTKDVNKLNFEGVPVQLTQTATSIGGSTSGGSGTIDVNYKGAGDNAYVNLLNENATTTYSTNVTYEIIAG